jgi:NhaA family Na+:H+ antiporter
MDGQRVLSAGRSRIEAIVADHPPGNNRRVRAVISSFGVVVRPLQEFFRLEAASGILLFVAAVAALVWANSPGQGSYQRLLTTPLTLAVGGQGLQVSLQAFINDGLMSVFFLLVGMEIKRELVAGELRTFPRAVLPAIAALGGMVVPSAIYLAFNAGGPGHRGWGIPMATDIAFCIGCLTLLGRRVPHALKVFLTALAIFDDIGGILVIAVFYGHGLHAGWLLAAVGVTLGLLGMNRLYLRSGLAYALAGGALWYALHAGGIHATISGVVLGLIIPARPRRPAHQVLTDLGDHVRRLTDGPARDELDDAAILNIEQRLEDLAAPLTRFVHALHPWVAFGIMPLFALANSGVTLTGGAGLGAPVALGVALGLVAGKPIGILLTTYLAVRSGLARRPGEASWARVAGVSIVGGIGFTVALFIAALAFPDHPDLLDQAKLGILTGSATAALLGLLVLGLVPKPPPAPAGGAGPADRISGGSATPDRGGPGPAE